MHALQILRFPSNAYNSFIHRNTGLTCALQEVQNSLQYINNPVQLVGNVLNHTTTKFSVEGDESYSVVNFTFQEGKCYAKCTDGICRVQVKSHRSQLKNLASDVPILHTEICSISYDSSQDTFLKMKIHQKTKM